MGTFTLVLGTSLQLQFSKRSVGHTRQIPRVLGSSPHEYSLSNSRFLSDFSKKHLRRIRFTQPSYASASWPYESWEADDVNEDLNRPWISFGELDGGFEVLAMGLGVLISVLIAASRRGASGIPVGALSLVFLIAAAIALRHQLGNLWVALTGQLQTMESTMADQLSSMRDNARLWGVVISKKIEAAQMLAERRMPTTNNGASVHSPLSSKADAETAQSITTEGPEISQEDKYMKDLMGLSSLDVEAALLDVAKSVAQLTMVVANLEKKIASAEKKVFEPQSEPRLESPTLEFSPDQRNLEDATTSPASSSFPVHDKALPVGYSPTASIPQANADIVLEKEGEVVDHWWKQGIENPSTFGDIISTSIPSTGVDLRQNGSYHSQGSAVNDSKAQWNAVSRKWEEAVAKDNSVNGVNPHVDKGYGRTEVGAVQFSEYDNMAERDQIPLIESDPMDVTSTSERGWTPSSQSAPLEYSEAQIGETSMEVLVQDTGDGPPEIGASSIEGPVHSVPKCSSRVIATTKIGNESMGGQLSNCLIASPDLSGIEDERTVMNKIVQDNGSYSHNDTQIRDLPNRMILVEGIDRPSMNDLDISDKYTSFSSAFDQSGNERGYHMAFANNSKAFQTSVSTGGRSVRRTQLSAPYGEMAMSRPKRNTKGQNDTLIFEVDDASVLYKEKPAISLELRATQSGADWDNYPAPRATGNNRQDEYGELKDRDCSNRVPKRSQGVDDKSSYEGQEQGFMRKPGPADRNEGVSSSKAEYDKRWQRGGPSEPLDVEFGGNGSSSDEYEGGNGSKRRWGQSDERSSGKNYETDEEKESEAPRSQEDRSTTGPSYPPERTETYKNLPALRSKKPEDERFQQLLDEVEALLNEGREGLEGRIEVGVAERMLYEAADLCAKAAALRPSSIVAIGTWGNTLLLHGELKLRLSQNLRSMLPDPSSKSLTRRDSWEAEQEQLGLEATLQDVCEECEQLLVEAGRKYRLALSMDRTDMRALYNWGLALCYRGQLIAEEGGETAAQDADKVYLAAIDKFEAMMGLSDKYAAGALLNWGLAMRDRSRLRPLGSKERRKIMAQAREIFQEALRIDPNYGQARGAVAACIVELKELQEYEEPEEPTEKTATRGFRDWWG